MGKQNLFWNGEKRRRLWTTEQKKEMTENRYRGDKAVHKAGGRDNGVLSVGWNKISWKTEKKHIV